MNLLHWCHNQAKTEQ